MSRDPFKIKKGDRVMFVCPDYYSKIPTWSLADGCQGTVKTIRRSGDVVEIAWDTFSAMDPKAGAILVNDVHTTCSLEFLSPVLPLKLDDIERFLNA